MSKRGFDEYVDDARQHYQDEESKKSLELDRRFQAQARLHAIQLEAAAERHAKVRKSAERAALLHMIEYEQHQKQQEEFERSAIAEAEKNLKLQEAQNRQRQREAELNAAEEAARRAEAEAEERKRHEEKLAEAAAKEEEQKRRQLEASQPPKTNGDAGVELAGSVKPVASTTPIAHTQPTNGFAKREPSTANKGGAQAVHAQYLDLHQHLKIMRKHVEEYGQKDKTFKTKIGDARRSIRQILSTLSMEPRANMKSRERLAILLKEACSMRQLMLDGSSFVVRPLPQVFDQTQIQVPAALIYLLNIFAKRTIAQFLALADTKTEWAEPVGIMASSMFASRDFTMQGISFIDLLLAKFHKACPILFGVPLEKGARNPTAPFLTAMGAGFAAISLRNYSKSKLTNPYPPGNFWTAVARIVNLTPALVTEHHMILLRAMMETGANRFINFFGQAALVAIRKAIVEFPRDVPIPVASAQLVTLQSIFEKTLMLDINNIDLRA